MVHGVKAEVQFHGKITCVHLSWK